MAVISSSHPLESRSKRIFRSRPRREDGTQLQPARTAHHTRTQSQGPIQMLYTFHFRSSYHYRSDSGSMLPTTNGPCLGRANRLPTNTANPIIYELRDPASWPPQAAGASSRSLYPQCLGFSSYLFRWHGFISFALFAERERERERERDRQTDRQTVGMVGYVFVR